MRQPSVLKPKPIINFIDKERYCLIAIEGIISQNIDEIILKENINSALYILTAKPIIFDFSKTKFIDNFGLRAIAEMIPQRAYFSAYNNIYFLVTKNIISFFKKANFDRFGQIILDIPTELLYPNKPIQNEPAQLPKTEIKENDNSLFSQEVKKNTGLLLEITSNYKQYNREEILRKLNELANSTFNKNSEVIKKNIDNKNLKIDNTQNLATIKSVKPIEPVKPKELQQLVKTDTIIYEIKNLDYSDYNRLFTMILETEYTNIILDFAKFDENYLKNLIVIRRFLTHCLQLNKKIKIINYSAAIEKLIEKQNLKIENNYILQK